MVPGGMPVIPGAILPSRPIGVREMEDEAGLDARILAVPLDRITPLHRGMRRYHDLPEIELRRIAHFFEHYKDPEPDEWIRIEGRQGAERAHRIIREAMARWQPVGD